MKVIFLDFDGVLNTDDWDPVCNADTFSAEWLAQHLNPRLVSRVATVADATGAVVVLSTSWRTAFPLCDLEQIVSWAGWNAPIIGATPQMNRQPRDYEIHVWLKRSGVTSYVILDDDEMTDDELRRRQVLCDSTRGLEEWQVDEAVEILNG